MKDVLSKTRCAAYTMDALEWDAVSKEAKNLVDRLLTVDVEKRATADDVFNHPWMAADARVRKVHLPHFCANRKTRCVVNLKPRSCDDRRTGSEARQRPYRRKGERRSRSSWRRVPVERIRNINGTAHLKKVASLTSSGLDKTEYKGKACDEKPASGGWFS